jgi:ferrous iron transport protein A
MNAPFQPEMTGLDRLKVGTRARVASVNWAALDEGEACRLRHFGFDDGGTV